MTDLTLRRYWRMLQTEDVDTIIHAAEHIEQRLPAPKWLTDTPVDGRVHTSPGGIGFVRIHGRKKI